MEFIVIHPSCYQILTHTFINYFFCLDWAQHGISGRAVFLDLYRYYTSPKSDQGAPSPLPYDPWTSHSITVPELEACARAQGLEGNTDIRRAITIAKCPHCREGGWSP